MHAVYATDLSDAIETMMASRVCLECLERYGITDIHLVNVVSPNTTTGMPGSDIGKRTKRALERQSGLLEREGFTVRTHVFRGTPHRRINGLADRVGADLIIAGTRGHSPLKQRFIGSTARNLARTTVRPLLLTRIVENEDDYAVSNEHLFQRVLYATDFSDNAAHAFEQFQYLTEATHEATLLHVRPPERRPDATDVDDAETKLAALADRLSDLGIDATTMIHEGDAPEEILAAEAAVDPTSILLGTRGRSRIRRLLLGSTSEDVTARAQSNILLVPPSGTR